MNNLINETFVTTNKQLATYLRYKGYQFTLAVSDTNTGSLCFVILDFIFSNVPDIVIRDYFHDTPEVILFKNIIATRNLMNESINSFSA
jgi:hypothetical protein